MLDKKSVSVLKVLSKLAEGTAYKVVTSDEIIANLTAKSQYDVDGVNQILEYLEKQDYINIKFSEGHTFCYALLPKARIYLEQETGKAPKQKKNQYNILNYVFVMISAFIGTMLALLIFFSFI